MAGRFSLQLEVGMPSAEQREAILKLILGKAALEATQVQGVLDVNPQLIQARRVCS